MRVTEVIKPLYEDDLSQVPQRLLEIKSGEGKAKHKRNQVAIESSFVHTKKNSIEDMFRRGCEAIGVVPAGICEDEIIENDPKILYPLIGHPDFYNDKVIIDYKFTNKLEDHYALQGIAYEYLLEEERDLYFFHYPNDWILNIYKVKESVKPILRDFFLELMVNYSFIRDCPVDKLNALLKWRDITGAHSLYDLVATIVPEFHVVDYDDTYAAADALKIIKDLNDQADALRAEIKRFMKENGETKLASGFRIIQKRRKKYNIPDEVKRKYEDGFIEYEELRLL